MERNLDTLKGKGYWRSDNDGFNGDGPEWCPDDEANAELLVQAAKELLDAKEIETE